MGMNLSIELRLPGLHGGFVRSAAHYPSRPALKVGSETLTYSERDAPSSAIGGAVRTDEQDDNRRTAVFAYRSITAFDPARPVARCGAALGMYTPYRDLLKHLRLL
jgi:hypothetical protein